MLDKYYPTSCKYHCHIANTVNHQLLLLIIAAKRALAVLKKSQ